MTDLDGIPTCNTPPVLHRLQSKETQCTWLLEQATAIKKKLLSPAGDRDQMHHVTNQATAIDVGQELTLSMKQDDGSFQCKYCNKKPYIRQANLRKHLTNTHNINLDGDELGQLDMETQPTEAGGRDSIPLRDVLASFCRMCYLYRDTQDAYKMADGDRIFTNAKFEMLYAFSVKHTKYRLWLWRLLAYEMALLTQREAFEYKWNACTNLQGGVGNNIPNDNAVELQVGEIKKTPP